MSQPSQNLEDAGKPESGASQNPVEVDGFKKGYQEGFQKGFKDGKSEEGDKDKEKDGKKEEKKDGKDEGKKGEKDGIDDEEKEKKPPIYKRPRFLIITSIVLLVLIIGGIIFWLIARQYVSTDDAYIDGHVSQVSAQVSAQVKALHIDDNQFVHGGDLLIELDPTDYQVTLEQAQAQVVSSQGHLAQAEAQTNSANAAVVQANAAVDAAAVNLENASRDLKRFRDMCPAARSQEQLDDTEAAQKNSQAQLDQANARRVSAESDVRTSMASVKAALGDLRTAEANERRAEVNLSYCNVYAPDDGRVTQRTVEAGNFVAPGQAMLLRVAPDVWVTANFKETQLRHMRPGQPVTIKVDAYPDVKFHGHVDSIQAGSGSRFSVLPAENATGNFVKVVERVPVKIVFEHDGNTNDVRLLSPGLSVIPRVKVR